MSHKELLRSMFNTKNESTRGLTKGRDAPWSVQPLLRFTASPLGSITDALNHNTNALMLFPFVFEDHEKAH
jgi:hypothetical protein